VAFENGSVSFRWRDYAHGGKKKIMTVSAHEFLRRFLLHVLPKGLVRIRHFGIFANRRRSAAFQRCRALCDISPSVDPPEIPRLRCPACSGTMLVVERLTCSQLYFRSTSPGPHHGDPAMTAPERRMTYRGPFDRLRYRVPARNASLRSRMSSNSRTIASKMKIKHAFHLDASCPPLHPSRPTLALPSLTPSVPIEIP
jgi:hypothetical protein